MATLKVNEIEKMSKTEKNKKIRDLKIELIKSRASPSKKGSKIKEIKKIIARITATNNQNK